MYHLMMSLLVFPFSRRSLNVIFCKEFKDRIVQPPVAIRIGALCALEKKNIYLELFLSFVVVVVIFSSRIDVEDARRLPWQSLALQ